MIRLPLSFFNKDKLVSDLFPCGGHKHHKLILQYAHDSQLNKKPWELWEINYKSSETGFRQCKMRDMCFYAHREYRRKS